jgi:hypothetical protein
MEDEREQVVSSPTELRSAEERMLGTELVREMVARRERCEGIKRIARELGVDRKTVKRWLKLGAWQPRQPQRRERQLDRFAEFIERRAPEVGFNGVERMKLRGSIRSGETGMRLSHFPKRTGFNRGGSFK